MKSTPAATFDALYQERPDPWNLESSAYERDKYRATLEALPPRRFASGLEIGCSIGVLSRMLAGRCASFLGIDFAEAALAAARARCADIAAARFERYTVPAEWPAGCFDLIVISELLYFLSPEDVKSTAARTLGSLTKDGIVLLVNFLGEVDTPSSGDGAAECFIKSATGSLAVTRQSREKLYRLDVLHATGGIDSPR